MTSEALVRVLRRVIDANKLREAHGEDTIGVLMKCGAFDEVPVAQLARHIEEHSEASLPETYYAGLARRFVECRDVDHAILFLTVGVIEEDAPKELWKAVNLCNMYLAFTDEKGGKRKPPEYKGDAWTDFWLKALEIATAYYVSQYPDRPVPSWS